MRLSSHRRLFVAVLAVGAIAAPSAQAFGPGTGAAIDQSGRAQQQPASTSAGGERPSRADQLAAAYAAANPSASLDRFGLVHIRKITPITTSAVSGSSGPEDFHFGDAAIGAGVLTGLVLIGTAGTLAASRRRHQVVP
jgi:hypothetical protein